MRLNQHTIYAILLAIYIKRAGRANLRVASENLGLSLHFLEQISRKMRKAGIIIAHRGPGGGYSLNGDPNVGAIMAAVGTKSFLTQADQDKYRTGNTEHRTLSFMVGQLSWAIQPILRLSVSELAGKLTTSELELFESGSNTQVAS